MLSKAAPALAAALLLIGLGAATAQAQPPGEPVPLDCRGETYVLTNTAGTEGLARMCAELREIGLVPRRAIWDIEMAQAGVKVQGRFDRTEVVDLAMPNGVHRDLVGTFELRACKKNRCGSWTSVR